MKKWFSVLTNKYLLSFVFLIVWIVFFNEINIFDQKDKLQELSNLNKKKAYYIKEIEAAKQELSDMKNNPEALEKYAREKYLMKKEGEDIYIVEEDSLH